MISVSVLLSLEKRLNVCVEYVAFLRLLLSAVHVILKVKEAKKLHEEDVALGENTSRDEGNRAGANIPRFNG